MSSRDDIEKAIEVVEEEIEYIKMTDPNATVEIECLEFTIISLEGYRERDKYIAQFTEKERHQLLTYSQVYRFRFRYTMSEIKCTYTYPFLFTGGEKTCDIKKTAKSAILNMLKLCFTCIGASIFRIGNS